MGHLWWRVLNGELPAVTQPRLFTMLIGTNDLTAADCHRNETELLLTVPGIAARRASPHIQYPVLASADAPAKHPSLRQRLGP